MMRQSKMGLKQLLAGAFAVAFLLGMLWPSDPADGDVARVDQQGGLRTPWLVFYEPEHAATHSVDTALLIRDSANSPLSSGANFKQHLVQAKTTTCEAMLTFFLRNPRIANVYDGLVGTRYPGTSPEMADATLRAVFSVLQAATPFVVTFGPATGSRCRANFVISRPAFALLGPHMSKCASAQQQAGAGGSLVSCLAEKAHLNCISLESLTQLAGLEEVRAAAERKVGVDQIFVHSNQLPKQTAEVAAAMLETAERPRIMLSSQWDCGRETSCQDTIVWEEDVAGDVGGRGHLLKGPQPGHAFLSSVETPMQGISLQHLGVGKSVNKPSSQDLPARNVVFTYLQPDSGVNSLWQTAQLLLRSLHAVESDALLVAFAPDLSSPAALGLRALGDSTALVEDAATGTDFVVLVQKWLADHPQQTGLVMLTPLDTVFQIDPFRFVESRRGVALFANNGIHQHVTNTLGVCTGRESEHAVASHPTIDTAIMLGSADVVALLIRYILQWYNKVEAKFRGSTCTFAHIANRLVWARTVAEKIPVIIYRLAGAPVLDLEAVKRSAWHVERKKIVLSSEHGGAGTPAAVVVRYGRHFVPDTDQLKVMHNNHHPQRQLPKKFPHAQAEHVRSQTGKTGDSEPAGGALPRGLHGLKVTYDSCVAKIGKNRPKTLKKILWLHIPKCGTSLGTVLHGYLCQAQETPYENPHYGKGSLGTWCVPLFCGLIAPSTPDHTPLFFLSCAHVLRACPGWRWQHCAKRHLLPPRWSA